MYSKLSEKTTRQNCGLLRLPEAVGSTKNPNFISAQEHCLVRFLLFFYRKSNLYVYSLFDWNKFFNDLNIISQHFIISFSKYEENCKEFTKRLSTTDKRTLVPDLYVFTLKFHSNFSLYKKDKNMKKNFSKKNKKKTKLYFKQLFSTDAMIFSKKI